MEKESYSFTSGVTSLKKVWKRQGVKESMAGVLVLTRPTGLRLWEH